MADTASDVTKRKLIEAALESRFPGREVPVGGFVEIARGCDASKPMVSKVAKALGFRSANPHRASRRPEGCKHCGQEVEPGKRVCYECNYIAIACDTCGKIFRRRRDRLFERERDSRYADGMFCSRACVYERRHRISWRPPVI